MGWQLIDTAPKDVPILTWCTKMATELYGVIDVPGGFCAVLNSNNFEGTSVEKPNYGPSLEPGEPDGNWWSIPSEYYGVWVWPTHWQEAPQPPETAIKWVKNDDLPDGIELAGREWMTSGGEMDGTADDNGALPFTAWTHGILWRLTTEEFELLKRK